MFVINSDWKSARGQVYNIDLDRPRPQMNFNVRPWQLLFNDLCTAHDFPHFTQEKFAVCLPRQTVLSNCKNTFRCSFFSTCMTLTISPKEKIVTNKDMAWKKEKRGRKKLRWTRRVGLEWLYLCVVHRSDGPKEVRTCISIKMCIIKRQTSYS